MFDDDNNNDRYRENKSLNYNEVVARKNCWSRK